MPTTQALSIGQYFSGMQKQVWPKVSEILFHPIDCGIPLWQNPFIILFSAWIFCFIMENFLPVMQDYSVLKRKGFWVDIFYLFFIDFLIQVMGFIALTYTVEYVFTNFLSEFGVTLPLWDPSGIPFIFQFLIFFIVMDFCQFYAHYILHRVNFFWRFHKIHHAQETLGFASTRHFHVMEYLVLRPIGWIPAGLLGFTDDKYIICVSIYAWIAFMLVFFSHCNVKVKFGFLNKIIITPNTHYWHHAKNIPRKYGVNYASVLVIWDYLFKSYYLPDDPNLKPILGVPDNDVPKSFLGQLWYPFRQMISGKKDSQNTIVKTAKKKTNNY